MLRDVLANWINALGERDFDEPFMHLIRGMGFFDIHFTHGAYEFGKDFIAKRQDEGKTIQYAFQSKAGDMTGSEWQATVGQLEELVSLWKAHPNFDSSLPLEYRLVVTGRLKGKAAASATSYRERLLARGDGSFEVWERENLLDFLEASDPRESSAGVSKPFKKLLARVEAGEIGSRELEIALSDFSPIGTPPPRELNSALLESSLLVAYFVAEEHYLSALTAAAHRARLAAISAFVGDTPSDESTESVRQALMSYFITGQRVLDRERILELKPIDLAHASGSAAALFTYPVVCSRVMEFLGLHGLWQLERGQAERHQEIADTCRSFVETHPGCHKPVAERLATSIPPATLCLSAAGYHQTAEMLLKKTTAWLCERYEQSEAGLAPCSALPYEEIETLMGYPFDFVTLTPSRESTIAVALADLAYYLYPSLYPDVVNDIKAVKIAPSVIFPKDCTEAMFINRGSTSSLLNIDYPDETSAAPLKHHQLQSDPRVLEVVGGVTLPLVVSTVLRDRLFSDCYPRFISDYIPEICHQNTDS